MLKPILSFIFILTICVSCNTNSGIKQVAQADNEKKFKDLIQKFPDSSLLRENLVQFYRDSGNYDAALSETEKLIKKDSTNDHFWYMLGTLYFENEDTLNAIRSFQQAVQLKPNPEYIKSLGSLYAETKNPLALTMANILLAAPNEIDKKPGFFIKGLYFSSIGENLKAISFFDNCISIDYTDMFSYREKAICLYDLGKYNEAIGVLQKAIMIVSNFDEAYFWMGKCYEKSGNKKEAIKNYQTAIVISKDYVEAKEALARLQAE